MPYNFTDNDQVKGNWWKTENVGDKIQGTYIGKREVVNQLRGGNQWVYEIMTEDGEFWNVGGKPGIDAQMRRINLGQIIEFRFIEERPSKKPGMSATKIVQVFANKNVVNEKWLQEQEGRVAGDGDESEGGMDAEEVAKIYGGSVVSEPDPNANKIAEIEELAKTKLGVTDKSQVLNAVQLKTGLAYLDTNLDAIIAKLKEL